LLGKRYSIIIPKKENKNPKRNPSLLFLPFLTDSLFVKNPKKKLISK